MFKINRKLVIFISFFLVFIFFETIIYAESESDSCPTIVVNNTSTYLVDYTTGVEDTFDVTVDLVKNTGIAAMVLTLKYDVNAMTLVNLKRGNSLNKLNFLTTNTNTSLGYEIYPFKILWDGATTDYSTGRLLTLTFKVKEDAVVGNYEVTFDFQKNMTKSSYGVNTSLNILKGIVSLKQILVTFSNFDGNILEQSYYKKFSVPEYHQERPYKKFDDDYCYEFIGWDKKITNVTSEVIYTARFEKIPRRIIDMSDVKFENSVYVYDGLEKSITITGKLPEGVEVEYTKNFMIDAGSLQVTAYFYVNNEIYKDIPPMTATLTIVQTENYWTTQLNCSDIIYGNSFQPVAAAKYGEVHFLYSNEIENGYSEIMPKNVGIYYVKAYILESNNFQGLESSALKININKATYDLSNIIFSDKTYVYDNTEKELIIDGILPTGVIATYSPNKLKNVGSIAVEVSFSGDYNNYNEIANLHAKLSIIKADLSFIADLKTTSFGEPLAPLTFTTVGNNYDNIIPEIHKEEGLDIGSYVIYIFANNFNYNITLINGVYNITYENNYFIDEKIEKQKQDIQENPNLTEEEKEKLIDEIEKEIKEVKVSDITYGQNLIIDSTAKFGQVNYQFFKVTEFGLIELEEIPTLVGEYAVIAFVDATINYPGLKSREYYFIINKATYDLGNIQFNNKSFVYDGLEKELLISGTLPEGVTVHYQNNKLKDVGFTEAIANFDYDLNNYNTIFPLSACLTINKARNNFINYLTCNDVMYGDDLKPICMAKFGHVGYRFFNENYEELNYIPEIPGTYFIKAFVEDTNNYFSLESSYVKIHINKAKLSNINLKYEYDKISWEKVTTTLNGLSINGVTYSLNKINDEKVFFYKENDLLEYISTCEGQYQIKAIPNETYLYESSNVITVQSYKVNFSTQYGFTPPSQYIFKNCFVRIPAESLENEKYNFISWLDNHGDKWNFDMNQIVENTIIYARWIPKQFTITYYSKYDKSEFEFYGKQICYFGYEIIPMIKPIEINGYAFTEWYLDPQLTKKFNIETMPAENINVYGSYIWDIGLGDMNADGLISQEDVELYYYFLTNNFDNSFIARVADINGDGKYNNYDAALIKASTLSQCGYKVVSGLNVTGEEVINFSSLGLGDVNGDGHVNELDVDIYSKWITNFEERIIYEVADINADESYDIIDVTLIILAINNLEGYKVVSNYHVSGEEVIKDYDFGLGDVNSDGFVNEGDIDLYSLWLTQNNEEELNKSVADINKDNFLDILDIALIRKAILSEDGYSIISGINVSGEEIIYDFKEG